MYEERLKCYHSNVCQIRVFVFRAITGRELMKLTNQWATWLFIAGIVGARITMGLFFNVTGPTLPTLAKNCNVSVSTVSWIFTIR